MGGSLRLLGCTDRDEWTAVLSRALQHDVYHLPEYHEVAEQTGEGRALFMVYSEGDYEISLPLLVRPCDSVEGLEGTSSLDATSVYGYAGPVSSHEDPPSSVVANFQAAIRGALREQGVVALFSRLHPLMSQSLLVAGVGETIPSGTTVSIDLTLSPEEQVAQFRYNHKDDIKKLRRLGARCVRRAGEPAAEEFVRIYNETMLRVGADPYYLFDRDYFLRLLDKVGSHIDQFACLVDGEVICAGLFLSCEGIVQYHLSGTRTQWLKYAPMKLLLDDVRLWATGRGMRVFHLGGGVGAHEDSLFNFKAGFSDRRHSFAIWRWVLDRDEYGRLVERRNEWNARHGVDFASSSFFPVYRCSTLPILGATGLSGR